MRLWSGASAVAVCAWNTAISVGSGSVWRMIDQVRMIDAPLANARQPSGRINDLPTTATASNTGSSTDPNRPAAKASMGEGPELVAAVKAGIDRSLVEQIAALVDQPLSSVLATVGIAERTWARRKHEAHLTPAESDRTVRILRLVERAEAVLGDLPHARTWLSTPNRALDGSTPMHMASTETGASLVFDVLGRIEHGVFA